MSNAKGSFPEYNDENRTVWDTNADWWDDRIGDGNSFQDELIEPSSERLLNPRPGDVILDVACGAGRFTRRMAARGAKIIAFDQSPNFIARAKKRTPESANIDYHVLDATDAAAMRALGVGRFDKAVATMALMDIPTIEPLFQTLAELLKPGGHFVYSITHPFFHSADVQHFCELSEMPSGRSEIRMGVKVYGYCTPFAKPSEGIFGQPVTQYYFHRPLSLLLQTGFDAGFVVDGMEEPQLTPEEEQQAGVRWVDMPDIPPLLIVRLRLPFTA